MSKLFFLASIGIFCAACSTTAPAQKSTGPKKTMLSYEEETPLTTLWENWTPSPKSKLENRFSKDVLFDYWRVQDSDEIEEVWSVLATLLSALGTQSEDENVKLSIRSTLNILEPTAIDRSVSTLDFSFLTSGLATEKSDRWEGLMIRWSKETHETRPTISLFLSRRANSKSSSFDRIKIYVEPGFSELPIRSYHMEKKGTWIYRSSPGLDLLPQTGEPTSAKIYAETLDATLWGKVTQASYVKFEKMESDRVGSIFGEVKMRDIEMVFENTQFPPRFNFGKKDVFKMRR